MNADANRPTGSAAAEAVVSSDMGLLAVHSVCGLHERLGGTSRSVAGLCPALQAAGVDSRIVTVRIHGEGPCCTTSVTTVPVDGWRFTSLGQVLAPGFRAALRAELTSPSDVVLHDHGLWLLPNQQAVSEAVRRGVPVVISPEGMLSQWALRQNRLVKKAAWLAFQGRNLSRASVIHATSVAEADDIRALTQTPIAIVPNGVDLPVHVQRLRNDGAARVALFFSRLHKVKGLELLLEAWSLVRPKGWRLLVCGSGSPHYTGRLKQFTTDLGIHDSVAFEGNVAERDKEKMFATADLMVLPTMSENFGLVVAEALARSVPVITTRGAPWRDLEDYGCGWWTAIDVAAFAEALRTATSMSEEALAAMGDKGNALVREKYSWDTVADQMIALYRWLIRGGQVPASMKNDHNRVDPNASDLRERR